MRRMGTGSPPGAQVRLATGEDAEVVADLAAELAQSFSFDRASFDASYPALIGNCALVALATRRAKPFYLAIGYEESAAYLRKLTP
jgi:hypothetical protein